MAIGTDYLLSALVREGLDHLFMVPGGLIDPFMPALARNPGLKPIVAAHEGGAAYMADGYARASGRFGAAMGIGGPGLANMTTAVAAAKTDFPPVLVLSGEIPLDMEGLGEFQDASQFTLDDTSLMRPVTRLSGTVAGPRNFDHTLRHALATMLAHPRGPAHLSLTHDVLTGDCGDAYVPVTPYFAADEPLSRPAAEAALATLLKAGRIAILAGAGVEDAAAAALRQVAERWSIPVATTLRAKGAFPEDHPLSLGVFGYAGTRHATAAILSDDIEALLILGSGMNERDTMHWTVRGRSKAAMVHVNIDMTEMVASAEAGHAVPGSAGAFLAFLLAAEGTAALDAGIAARKAWLSAVAAGPRLYDTENCTSTAVPIHPAAAITALRAALPRDGTVLVDSGAHRAFAGHYWSSYAPNTYISATNLGPMGWAIPAAVGVQCARPGKRVAVITGDGCMQMHGMEVQTAARYRLPVIYLVLNNAALGNVWLRAHQYGALPSELTTVVDHDWAGFGRALGAHGITVTDPARLSEAMAEAVAANTTVIVEVKADRKYPTPVYDFAAGARAWSYQE